MDETLMENLDGIKNLINNRDYDWVHLIIGGEGIGKSTLGLELCKYIDPKFCDWKIVFDLKQFKSAVMRAAKGSAIMIDEGALMLFSREALVTDVREAIKLFSAIREYNLFICINVPNFFIIDKYIREHRVKSVTRIVKRGWFHFYSKSRTSLIHRDKKKPNRIIYPTPNFRAHFPRLNGNLWDIYLKRKVAILKRESEVWITTSQAAKMLHVVPRTIFAWIQQGKIKATKLGDEKGARWKIKKSDVHEFINSQYSSNS
jgi:excisionase family DNA binding protein